MWVLNRASGILEVLTDCGHADKWEEERHLNYSKFKLALEERYAMHAKEEWKIECTLKPSLVEYCRYRDKTGDIYDLSYHERRALMLARYNLPTLVERVTHDGEQLWRCKLCLDLVDEKWLHALRDCRETYDIRNSNPIEIDQNNIYAMLYSSSSALTKLLLTTLRKMKGKLRERNTV